MFLLPLTHKIMETDIDIIKKDGAKSDPAPRRSSKKEKPSVMDLVGEIEKSGSESILESKRPATLQQFQVRPVRLGSIEMLRKIGSPLINGVSFANPSDLLGDALEFIYIHVVDERLAIDHCFLPKVDREKAVMLWAMGIEVGNVAELIQSTIGTLVKATNTQVKGIPPEHARKAAEREQIEEVVTSGKE